MSEKKSLLNNLIFCKNNIKRKVLDMKRNAIDSDNYFREIFKPLLEPLNTLSKKNERSVSNDFPNGKVNTEIRDTSDKDDDSTLLNTTFINFLNTRPQSRRYDRPYGLYYDRDNDQLKISDLFLLVMITYTYSKSITHGLLVFGLYKVKENLKVQDMEAYYDNLKTT